MITIPSVIFVTAVYLIALAMGVFLAKVGCEVDPEHSEFVSLFLTTAIPSTVAYLSVLGLMVYVTIYLTLL